jgi:hypothetical protein
MTVKQLSQPSPALLSTAAAILGRKGGLAGKGSPGRIAAARKGGLTRQAKRREAAKG